MSFMEIIIIAIVAVLVLGPDKLPSTMLELAKLIKAVKKQINDAKTSIENEINISELKDEARRYKEEITKANDSIRKKLSFEEFDEIKNSINDFEKEARASVENTLDTIVNDDNLSKREQFKQKVIEEENKKESNV